MNLGLSMPEWSLLFFLGVFLALLAWLFVFRRRGWERESRLPLDSTESDRDTRTNAPTEREGDGSHG